jgi:hypothetical protein
MKKSLVILGLICTQFINAQKKLKSIDTLDLNKITAEDVSKKYKNGFDVEIITLKDGTITQKGSDFIIGSPSNPENINNNVYNGVKVSETLVNYTFLMVGKYSLMGDMSATYFSSSFSQTEIVVESIKVFRTKKTIQIVVDFTKKDGTNTGIGKYGSILNLEEAILKGEIINPNRPMTRIQAIAKLKKAKDLLEIEMMSQQEYDKLKSELSPIIKGGKG